jgi:hypothetical protein
MVPVTGSRCQKACWGDKEHLPVQVTQTDCPVMRARQITMTGPVTDLIGGTARALAPRSRSGL